MDALNDEEYDAQTKDECASEGGNVSRSITSSRAGVEGVSLEDTPTAQPLEVQSHTGGDMPTPSVDDHATSLQLSSVPSDDTEGSERNSISASRRDKNQETPKVSTKPLEEDPPALPTSSTVATVRESDNALRTQQELDHIRRSAASTADQDTDAFLSAPSTPTALSV